MRFYECTSVFQYPWEQVAQALWQRYPNPESSHVLSEDTYSRRVESNKLYTKRVLTKTNRLPKWGERFVSSRNVGIVEESIVDPASQVICTYTRNVGLTKVMSIIEKVTYRPCPTNPQWTIAERRAWVDSRIFGFGYAIQKFGVERFRKNIAKANFGFNYALKRLFNTPKVILDSVENHQEHPTLLEEHRIRLKDAAKRATEIAKEKSRSAFAACES